MIPCTVDVKLRVDTYPDDPIPDTELTREFIDVAVLMIPCTVEVRERLDT